MRCRPERWWRGLPVLALIAGGAGWWTTPAIEADLTGRLQQRAAAGTPHAPPLPTDSAWASVEAEGRDAVLRGAAPSREVRDALLGSLREVRGVGRIVDRTTIRVRPETYAWGARREEGRLVLRGHVPDAGTRRALLEEARRLAPALAVEDGAGLQGGAPSPFAAGARAALRIAVGLEGGEVELLGTTLSASGTAPSWRRS